MAIEDAAVLGNLFSRLSDPCQIKYLLLEYQQLRLPRTAEVQLSSRLNQHIFHLPDGPEQVARDESMRTAMNAELSGNKSELANGNPNQWADKSKNIALFGYDADLEVERWWNRKGEKELRSLLGLGSAKL
jgi:salicylate hydroxylase